MSMSRQREADFWHPTRPWTRSPLPRWLVRSTLAVAHFREAPTSSDPDLGDRPLVALGGLPAALPQAPGDHDPVALGEGVGQILGLTPPDIHLEE